MKVSAMDLEDPLHAHFARVARAFQQAAPWRVLTGNTHMRLAGAESDALREFPYCRCTDNKVQIFRDYGDCIQAESCTDVHMAAAPEGHVELEIRPEKVDGSEERQPLPRINVYVPTFQQHADPRGGPNLEKAYTRREPSRRELESLAIAAAAVTALAARAAELKEEDLPERARERCEEARIVRYEPFQKEVSIVLPCGTQATVVVSSPCSLSSSARVCEFCRRRRENMDRCAQCKVAHYCCPQHQRLHWKAHKKGCKAAAESAQDALVGALPLPCCQGGPLRVAGAAAAWGIAGRGVWRAVTATTGAKLEDWHGGPAAGQPACSAAQVDELCAADPPALWAPLAPPAPRQQHEGDQPPADWPAMLARLGFPPDGQHAAALSAVATLWHCAARLDGGAALHRVLETPSRLVHIHLIDCCLEAPLIPIFGLLRDLLPPGLRIRVVLCGKRMDPALHYRVYSYGTEGRAAAVPATGTAGDVWHGYEGAMALRLFCDDYGAFLKNTPHPARLAHFVVGLFAAEGRHSFWSSTTHAVAEQAARADAGGGAVALAAYSRAGAERIASSVAGVAATGMSPLRGFALPALNPFRSPLAEDSVQPQAAYANAYVMGWLPAPELGSVDLEAIPAPPPPPELVPQSSEDRVRSWLGNAAAEMEGAPKRLGEQAAGQIWM